VQQTKDLLSGERFSDESNKVYKVPVDELDKRTMNDSRVGNIEVIDFEAQSTIDMIVGFIEHHKEYQVPRLQELKNYYDTKNNIKYRKKKSSNRADNRIASDFAKFNCEFKTGVIAGNPIEYTGEDNVTAKIDEFATRNDESQHNRKMINNALIYGKSYELIYRDEYADEAIKALDPRETFVIYDTTMDMNSVCGVRYYTVSFNKKTKLLVEVYANDGFVYHFSAENNQLQRLELVERKQSFFDAVQINQWNLNDEQASDFENVMDQIDAYDLNQSEMANFMQDNSEALLVIKGNPDTFKKEDGSVDTDGMDYSVKNRFLILGDKKFYIEGDNAIAGTDPDAEYLVKTYDVDGVEANNERLVSDILRFTHLVDFTDENMGGNQSGIGFRFKSWGNENDRVSKERMITKNIRRRLRLLAYSWSIKEPVQDLATRIKNFISYEQTDNHQENYEAVNDVEIKFTPNVPQSDEEIMKVIDGMHGIVSEQTIFEMSKRLTGVDAEVEMQRVEDETDSFPDPRRPIEPVTEPNTDLSDEDGSDE
jgi:SPP1 family phage portal protein